MTTVLFVRHAAHDRVDRVLCGRMPGVQLGAPGLAQAARIAQLLAREQPLSVYSSPQPRAMQTAAALGMPVVPCAALDEIDFGRWTGREFAALADDPQWRAWNAQRATARPPDGEAMADVQQRVLAWLGTVADRSPIAAFSHGDVIKATLFGLLGLSLDAHARLEISPGGISAVAIWPGGGKVLSVNEVVH